MSRVSTTAPQAIIIAPDKFKGTLNAVEVAGTIGNAITKAFPDTRIIMCPMADGGEGTAGIVAGALGLVPDSVELHDALMGRISAMHYSDAETCAVDSAAIVGLAMLDSRYLTPWQTTSHGIGEYISRMLQCGKKRIYIGIGGTATIDGGIGMLAALGARFFDVEGCEITERPLRARHLGLVYSADFSGIDRAAIKQAVTILSDVDVPLTPTGDELSALSFARQKGVDAADIPLLKSSFRNFASVVDAALHAPAVQPPFQGAGGGLGYALHRILRCKASSGATMIANDIYDMETLTTTPGTVIITGEGHFDDQSLKGKAAGTLLSIAAKANIPALVVCGDSDITVNSLTSEAEIITTAAHINSNRPLTHDTALEALQNSCPQIIESIRKIRI